MGRRTVGFNWALLCSAAFQRTFSLGSSPRLEGARLALPVEEAQAVSQGASSVAPSAPHASMEEEARHARRGAVTAAWWLATASPRSQSQSRASVPPRPLISATTHTNPAARLQGTTPTTALPQHVRLTVMRRSHAAAAERSIPERTGLGSFVCREVNSSSRVCHSASLIVGSKLSPRDHRRLR